MALRAELEAKGIDPDPKLRQEGEVSATQGRQRKVGGAMAQGLHAWHMGKTSSHSHSARQMSARGCGWDTDRCELGN
jgi:hypothetical protein